MKSFTVLETIVALSISSILLILAINSYRLLINLNSIDADQIDYELITKGMEEQLLNISKIKVKYSEKEKKEFLTWDGDRLIFITSWSSKGNTLVCYTKSEKGWQYSETILKNYHLSDPLCNNTKAYLPIKNLKIFNKEQELVTEINTKKNKNYILEIKTSNTSKKFVFKF